jgi:hypothetical protein
MLLLTGIPLHVIMYRMRQVKQAQLVTQRQALVLAVLHLL